MTTGYVVCPEEVSAIGDAGPVEEDGPFRGFTVCYTDLRLVLLMEGRAPEPGKFNSEGSPAAVVAFNWEQEGGFPCRGTALRAFSAPAKGAAVIPAPLVGLTPEKRVEILIRMARAKIFPFVVAGLRAPWWRCVETGHLLDTYPWRQDVDDPEWWGEWAERWISGEDRSEEAVRRVIDRCVRAWATPVEILIASGARTYSNPVVMEGACYLIEAMELLTLISWVSLMAVVRSDAATGCVGKVLGRIARMTQETDFDLQLIRLLDELGSGLSDGEGNV